MGQNTNIRGIVQAAVAMTTVGTLTAVSATVSRYPVYGGQAVRYAVAAVILLGVARLRGPRPGPSARWEWPLLAALAATGLAGFNVCIVEGTHYTSPATIGTVVGSVPVVLAVAAPLMEGRRPAARIVAAAAVVTAGAALANGLGGGSLPGLLLALGALAGEVCFSLLALPLLPRLGAVRVSAYSAAAAVPMLLAAGLAVDGTSVLRVPTRGEVAGLGYLSLVVTAGAFIVWYDALGRIGADRAGLFAGLIPVSAVATTVVLGLRSPGMAELGGALLVGLGVIVGLRRSAERPLAVAAPADDHDPAHDEEGHQDQAHDDQHPEDRRFVAEKAADHGV
ncbi:DMT family transporter [Actinoallomurus iriomotensis]|uniref:Membrane protein n=1 Tax=Actinoallomurus iriomotensis TaxID=478107 RepID=A0A9W6VIU1_9ACTN|nr:DMT family transporter [Actinoallomurus iriomotensis]GLY73313.1 membrane protein [Actinoallomurus iriomotensis]